MFSPSRHVNGAKLINFSMFVVFGSKPWAITEQHRSRSVIMPTSFRDCESATTGMEPILHLHRMFATVCAVSVIRQQAGSRLMISRIFMGHLSRFIRLSSCPLRYFDLVNDLTIAGVGLRDTQGQIVLLLTVDRAGQNHRVLVY